MRSKSPKPNMRKGRNNKPSKQGNSKIIVDEGKHNIL